MANLGHGRGPLDPFAFFIQQTPQSVISLDEEESAGDWFMGVQRSVAMAATAGMLAASAISAQSIGGQFEEIPRAVASPGVQQLVMSPTSPAGPKLRHFFATEELGQAVAPSISVDDNGQWVFQLPSVVQPSSTFQETEEVPPAQAVNVVSEDGWIPIVPTVQPYQQVFLGSEEWPGLVIASPGVQQSILSPIALAGPRLRHFYAAEDLPIAAAPPIFVDDDGQWTFQLPTPVYNAPVLGQDEVPSLAVLDEDGWIQPNPAVQSPPQVFSSSEELGSTAPSGIIDDTGSLPLGLVFPEQLIPAPWIDGGESLQGAVFEEDGLWRLAQTGPLPRALPLSTTEEFPGTAPSIGVDDVGIAPLGPTQPSIPPIVFSATEEVTSINVDDLSNWIVGQTCLPAPIIPFSSTEEIGTAPPLSGVDDTPLIINKHVPSVLPPKVFSSPEELYITPTFVDEFGFRPGVMWQGFKPPQVFIQPEEINDTTIAQGYLVGSALNARNITLKAAFRWTIKVSRNATGVDSGTYTVRFGAAGGLGDPALMSFTLPNGTAVADDAEISILVTVRGPLGAACIAQGYLRLVHNLGSTGFATTPGVVLKATSAPFNSAPNNLIAGVSVLLTKPISFTYEQVLAEHFG